ncbi:MAG: preprotein translocase subunit YajC [Angelakisella sp.]
MIFSLLNAAPPVNPTVGMLGTFVPLILVVVIFYFFLLRPQQKKEKQAQQMRSSLEVGDDITTIGGIVGTVVSLKEDTLVIETSGDRNKIRITRWAIQQNSTPKETAKATKEAKAKETKEAK